MSAIELFLSPNSHQLLPSYSSQASHLDMSASTTVKGVQVLGRCCWEDLAPSLFRYLRLAADISPPPPLLLQARSALPRQRSSRPKHSPSSQPSTGRLTVHARRSVLPPNSISPVLERLAADFQRTHLRVAVASQPTDAPSRARQGRSVDVPARDEAHQGGPLVEGSCDWTGARGPTVRRWWTAPSPSPTRDGAD